MGCNEKLVASNGLEKEFSMFTKASTKNYVIFSPLEGVLTRGDQPLANVTIKRRLRWNGNEEGLIEYFTTNEYGHFSLPIHEEDLALGMLNQFVAKVELTINDNELIWYGNKMFPEIYSETNGPVNELICDISAEEIPIFLDDSVVPNILTKCRWQGMPLS
jgi:hypothetical protein